MKKIFTVAALLLASTAFSQSDNVGIGTTDPDNSAILDLSSSEKGFLLPRMTESQRTLIKSPAQGLQVFQTNGETGLYIFDGMQWTKSTAGTSAAIDPWVGGGNNAAPGDFIGTLNGQPLLFKVANSSSGKITNAGDTYFGFESGLSGAGTYGTAIGSGALKTNGGTSNVAMGAGALSNVTSNNNVAIGTNALNGNGASVSGETNTAVGSFSLFKNTAGTNNASFGYNSMFNNLGGSNNLAIGTFALQNNTSGNFNVALGTTSLASNNGSGNLGIGANALSDNLVGNNNVAIGSQALRLNTGSGNVAIGNAAGESETGDGKLYIANSNTDKPLIYGDFAAKFVSIGDVPTGTRATAAASGGYNLLVKGGILTEKVKVALSSSGDWADYVFEPDYKLLPLSDVEKFILEHKHLPNVPSAEELADQGLDLGYSAKIFMEKIEEITLHLINLQKQVDSLRAENAYLKLK